MLFGVGVRMFMFTARAPASRDACSPAVPSVCRPLSATTRRAIDPVTSVAPVSVCDSATRNPSVLSDDRHGVGANPAKLTHGPRSGSLSALFVLSGPFDAFGAATPLLQKLVTSRN